MTTLDMPNALSTRVLNALRADPRNVDLRSQAPHFYNLGARMLDLFEEDEIVEVLTNVGCVLIFQLLSAPGILTPAGPDFQAACSRHC